MKSIQFYMSVPLRVLIAVLLGAREKCQRCCSMPSGSSMLISLIYMFCDVLPSFHVPGITYVPDLIMNFAGETVASWLNHVGLGSHILDLIFWGMTCSDGLEILNSPQSPQSHQSHPDQKFCTGSH